MGDLLGSPRVAPLFLFLLFFLLNLFYFRHYQRQHILHFTPHNLTGTIIPALMHRIPSELRSEVCLGESSTRMGDLLGSPRVAPLFLFLLFFLLNLFYFHHYQRVSLPISLLINFIFVAANTYYILLRITLRVRSYQHHCTGSHQNSAVKCAWHE